MQIHQLLDTRKAEILAEIEKLQTELSEIERMTGTIRTSASRPQSDKPLTTPATKDDAIVVAIEAGNTTPATISAFMRDKLGLQVNDASTRTRLSRMKASDKITHDGNGWKLK